MILGVVMIVIGALIHWCPQVPFLRWFGYLPGDIVIDKPHMKIVFPITSMIVVSGLLTLLLRLLLRR